MQIQTTVPYYACIRGGKRISNGRTVGSIMREQQNSSLTRQKMGN